MSQKQVIQWKPARVEIKDKSGNPAYIGKFRTKVPQGTPGATHQQGRNAAGKSWDFWAQDVDSISGQLRWIDVRSTDYGPSIALFVESPKALHQISIPYDVNNIHVIMNHFLGLGKELEVAYLNISYWVRKKLNFDKIPKLDKDGNVIWAKDISFRDVPVKWDFEAWKAFSEEHGLNWFQEMRAGKKVWNYEAELQFWQKQVVRLQRFLLTTEKCLPFCWNSITASASDGTEMTLTDNEIASVNAIYEGIKPLYNFNFGNERTNADDAILAPPVGYYAKNTEHAANPFDTVGITFPAAEPTNYENNAPDPGEDLPF